MARIRTTHYTLRIPLDMLAHLRELAAARGVAVSAHILAVLADHLKDAPRVRSTDKSGRPSAAKYAQYCRELERLFSAVDGRIPGCAVVRGRTQFEKWVSLTCGESNPLERTEVQWDKVFAAAKKFGDIFHERSDVTTPNDVFAMKIKEAADTLDALKLSEVDATAGSPLPDRLPH
jgi:hypothetical protein